MSGPRLSKPEDDKLLAAVVALRLSPAFPVVEEHLKRLLEDVRDKLVFNQTAQVPNLQGRAQQLTEVIELLNRKHTHGNAKPNP